MHGNITKQSEVWFGNQHNVGLQFLAFKNQEIVFV